MRSRKRERGKKGRNIFRTRVWIHKDRKTRVGGEKKEMEKNRRSRKKEIKKKKGIETKRGK